MPKNKYTLQKSPFVVPTEDGKYIGEHFGLASTGNDAISIAHMKAPVDWSEPFQTPDFEEYTLVISGKKQIEVDEKTLVLEAGESIKINAGTRVRYSNPFDNVCEYVSICTPAFNMDSVNREKE